MEIKAKCKHDFNAMKALTHATAFIRTKPLLWGIVFSAISAVLVVRLLIFGADIRLFLLLGVCVLAILLECVLYFALPRIRYNALGKLKDAEVAYIFGDDSVRCVAESEEFHSESEVAYSIFCKVVETSTYFIIYQTNNSAYIVDKSTLEGGTEDDLRNKLTVFVKDKYIRKNQ